MKVGLAGLLLVGVLAFAADGEMAAPILLKLKPSPDVGQTSITREQFRSELLMRVASNEGKTISTRKDSESAEEAFSDTTIREAAGQREFRRRYDRAVKTSRTGTRLLPRSGKSLLITDRGGEFSIRNESGLPLEAEETQELSKELKLDRKVIALNFCLPRSPVGIGQVWSIAAADASVCFNTVGDLEAAGSSASGKLLRIYDKNGRAFGTIEIDLALRVKNMGKLPFDAPAMLRGQVRIDGCIDGKSPEGSWSLTGSLEGSSHPQGNHGKPVLNIKLDLSADSTTTSGDAR